MTEPLRGTVLLVEDDEDTRDAVEDLVRSEGFDVVTAPNGAVALQRLRRMPQPAFILLDMMMPVMDGWEFRKAQRASPLLAKIPVIVFTAGHTAPWDVAQVIIKPLSRDKLQQAMRRVAGLH